MTALVEPIADKPTTPIAVYPLIATLIVFELVPFPYMAFAWTIISPDLFAKLTLLKVITFVFY